MTLIASLRIKKSVSAAIVTHLARHWIGRLAHYGSHHNDEHCLALFDEAIRYAGLHLENYLVHSEILVGNAAASKGGRPAVPG